MEMYTEFLKIESIIEKENFVIYGTGSVAKRFSKIIKEKGYWDNVSNYAVSSLQQVEAYYDGKDIKEINEVSNDSIVMIAVHNIFIDEIIEKLKNLGFSRYFWVYPYLFDLSFGLPIERNVEIDVRSLVKGLKDVYLNQILYLAIESALFNNTIGRDLYIKYMCIFCSEKAASKRWLDFVKRIHKYESGDAKQNYNIKLSNKLDIVIDGSHRLMLAYYFNVEKILADIYSCDIKRYIEFAENMLLNDEQLQKYFTQEEILLIKEVDLKLKA